MSHPTNIAQDAAAWIFGFVTAIAGFASLESWALVVGIVCTVFTTFSSYQYRKATLKTIRIKAALEAKANTNISDDSVKN